MRKEVAAFAECMEHKLKLNDHKGGWHKTDWNTLVNRLRAEVDELVAACENEPSLNIMFEAADVANFAMMIAHNAMRDMLAGTMTPWVMTKKDFDFARDNHTVGEESCNFPAAPCNCIPF